MVAFLNLKRTTLENTSAVSSSSSSSRWDCWYNERRSNEEEEKDMFAQRKIISVSMCAYSLYNAFHLPEGFANIWPTEQVVNSCCLFSGRKTEAEGLSDFSGVSLYQSPCISYFAQIACVLLCSIWFLLLPVWQAVGMKREGKPWQFVVEVGSYQPKDMERAELSALSYQGIRSLTSSPCKMTSVLRGLLWTFMVMVEQK